MELSTEQYKQVLRYVDGEMDTAEQKAFEALIAVNKELYEEVAFYKELQSVSEAAGQKPGNLNLSIANNGSDSEKVREMISQARQQWETEHENDLKIIPGRAEQDSNKNEVHTGIRSINPFKWLAAAIITGILLGGAWWYLQSNNKGLINTVSTQNNDSSTVANNKDRDTLKTILPPSPPPQTNNSKKIAEDKPVKKKHTVSKDSPQNQKADLSTISRKDIEFAAVDNNDSIRLQNIFARNFKPDLVPTDTIGSLRRAFAHYNEGDYKTAILEFDKKQSFIKRGANEEYTGYCLYYYRGLSYLAIDSVKKAIFNLKIAISLSPDNFLRSKAKWYQALAYLKGPDPWECTTLLRQLSSDKEAGEYQQKARSLLKELKL